MSLRAAGKFCWFAAEVFIVVTGYFFNVAFVSKKSKRVARAHWMHWAATRHLKLFDCAKNVSGPIPKKGLLVSNHLSYLDILVICATTPAAFVSKAEVRRWPVFGWLAKIGGTIFIERERRTHVGDVNREIQKALDENILVVIFPEGTSSSGATILPFRASLLEPAARGGHEISTAWLHYDLPGGDARQEVCYWGDHSFFPHLANLLGKKNLQATLRFGKFQKPVEDRKELAKQLHAAVEELKSKN